MVQPEGCAANHLPGHSKNFWNKNPLRYALGRAIGDAAAPFTEYGTNPLTGDFLSAEEINNAKFLNVVNIGTVGLAGEFTTFMRGVQAARGGNLVVGSGARQGVTTVARDTLAGTPDVIGRVQALPFRSGSMSSVSLEGLPFAELTPQAFREAARVLGPGGRIMGSTGRAADLGAIRSGLEQAGFRDISVQYGLGDAAGNYRVIFSGVGP